MKKLHPLIAALVAVAVMSALSGCGSKPKKSYFDWLADADTKMKAGSYEEAVKDFDEALKVRQDDPEVWYNRGNAFYRLGKLKEALQSYMKAVQLKPDFAQAHYNAGLVLTSLGRWDEAIEAYQRTVAIDPKHAKAWFNLGLVFKR